MGFLFGGGAKTPKPPPVPPPPAVPTTDVNAADAAAKDARRRAGFTSTLLTGAKGPLQSGGSGPGKKSILG